MRKATKSGWTLTRSKEHHQTTCVMLLAPPSYTIRLELDCSRLVKLASALIGQLREGEEEEAGVVVDDHVSFGSPVSSFSYHSATSRESRIATRSHRPSIKSAVRFPRERAKTNRSNDRPVQRLALLHAHLCVLPTCALYLHPHRR